MTRDDRAADLDYEADHPTDALTGRNQPAATDDDEVVFYEGSPLLRGELGLVALWFAIGLLIAAVPLVWQLAFVQSVDDPRPPLWLWLLVPLGLLVMLVPSLWVKRHRYRITNYRIDYESGILSTNIDTLELWHVNDIRMRQGFLDRIFGVGTITVDSDDRSTPRLELKSLAKPRVLYENLKRRVIAVKRQRGVIKMDMG